MTINPGLADAHYNLGNIYAALNNLDASIAHYERSINLLPTVAEAHNNFANVLRMRGRHEEAIEQYKMAIRLKPSYVLAQRNLGEALQSQNHSDGATVCYRAALAIEPGDATTLNRLASTLTIAGRLDEASRSYEEAIKVAPDNIGIQLNYASVKPFTNDDARFAKLEELRAREDDLSDEKRIALHFTLGKAYADIKDANRSFHHLCAGNRLKRQHVAYDERGTLLMIERIREVFTEDLLRVKSNRGGDSEVPVFVLGMPRSGTSLVEQILASHSRVFGAGEVRDFVTTVDWCFGPKGERLSRISQQADRRRAEGVRQVLRGTPDQERRREGSHRRQDAVELPVRWADSPGAAEGKDHSCQAASGRHVRVVLLFVVRGRPALRLRSRRARSLLQGL